MKYVWNIENKLIKRQCPIFYRIVNFWHRIILFSTLYAWLWLQQPNIYCIWAVLNYRDYMFLPSLCFLGISPPSSTSERDAVVLLEEIQLTTNLSKLIIWMHDKHFSFFQKHTTKEWRAYTSCFKQALNE